MRITGPTRVSPQTTTRATKKSGGDFKVAPSETKDAAAVSSAAPFSSIDALVALQSDEREAAADPRSRAASRGREILDILDSIRMEILLGRIPESRLKILAASLKHKRAEFQDPQLAAVLDEIDLRAQVELAKYSRD